jgi:hypothetical protein
MRYVFVYLKSLNHLSIQWNSDFKTIQGQILMYWNVGIQPIIILQHNCFTNFMVQGMPGDNILGHQIIPCFLVEPEILPAYP